MPTTNPERERSRDVEKRYFAIADRVEAVAARKPTDVQAIAADVGSSLRAAAKHITLPSVLIVHPSVRPVFDALVHVEKG